MKFPEEIRQLPRPYPECPPEPAQGQSVQVGYFHVEHRVNDPKGRPRFLIVNSRGRALAMGRRWRWCLARLGAFPDDEDRPSKPPALHWSQKPENAARAAAQRREFSMNNRDEPPWPAEPPADLALSDAQPYREDGGPVSTSPVPPPTAPEGGSEASPPSHESPPPATGQMDLFG